MAIGQNYRDTEPYWSAVSRRGSQRLLAALQAHHPDLQEHGEVSIPTVTPEPSMAEAPVEPESIATQETKTPSCPQWFSMVGEPVSFTPKINDIKRASCRYFDCTMVDMDSARRTLKLVYPRQIAMYLARSMTGKSLPEIGRRFGGRDHTTVLHGAKKIEAAIKRDWMIAYDVALVEAMI